MTNERNHQISVVIPLYNKEDYIERAVLSVQSQTLQNIEIIVIDDGSTDNSAAIVKNIQDSRISVIQQKNAGTSAARNRGIQAASSELVAFLDADDMWFPNHLETLSRLKQNYPEAGVFGTAYLVIQENDEIVLPPYSAIPPPPWAGLIPNYFRSALGFPPLSASSVSIPKYILEEFGGFPVGEKRGEDRYLWGRIALKHPIAFTWQVGAACFLNAKDRVCRTYPPKQEPPFARFAALAIEKQEVPPEFLDDLKEYVAKDMIMAAKESLIYGQDKHTARGLLKKSKFTTSLRRTRLHLYLLSLLPLKMTSFILKVRRNALSRTSK